MGLGLLEEVIMTEGRVVHNYAMERKLQSGEALDVNLIGKPMENFPGVWTIEGFLEDIDYCDAEDEQWIWSIGQDIHTGQIYASTDVRFANNPKFLLLWLR